MARCCVLQCARPRCHKCLGAVPELHEPEHTEKGLCASAEWMASKAPPLADVPFTGAEERRRMTCMVKAHCMQNKTFCKCVKCGDAVCGKCTAKVLNLCTNCV
ncbi:Hepatocyte growth factor-regulated tyrosine kinase substrate [Dissostichus eleginoides]|uniref:Hepatocyte growth factor-regulated tyrosine kinase substrate n=1 Tax=Dissostichus eleginoides TaxID=100907 RepID=A0AAD9F168_DISEL|nr:Hepatocyte growth factor-regulated tyrosine kinase substrate [Dissostichus eleginoides]